MARTQPIRLQIITTATGLRVLDDMGKSLTRMDLANKTTAKSLGALGASFSTVAKWATAAFAAFTGYQILRTVTTSFVDINRELELLELRLAGFIGTSEKAQEALSEMFDISAKTGYGVKSLAKAFTQMEVSGLDPMNGAFEDVIESVSALGGTEHDVIAVTRAFQQMAGKGVISMEEIRQQIAERIPTAMKFFSAAYGKTMSEFIRDVSRGKVTAELLPKAIEMMGEAYEGAMARIQATAAGQWGRLRAQWTETMREIGRSGAWDMIAAAMKTVSDRIEKLLDSDRFEVWARNVGVIITSAITMMVKAFNEFLKVVSLAARAHNWFMSLIGQGESKTQQIDAMVEKLHRMETIYDRLSKLSGVLAKVEAGLEVDQDDYKQAMFLVEQLQNLEAQGFDKWEVGGEVPTLKSVEEQLRGVSDRLQTLRSGLEELQKADPFTVDILMNADEMFDPDKFIGEMRRNMEALAKAKDITSPFQAPEGEVLNEKQLKATTEFWDTISKLEKRTQDASIAMSRRSVAEAVEGIEKRKQKYFELIEVTRRTLDTPETQRALQDFQEHSAEARVSIEKWAQGEINRLYEREYLQTHRDVSMKLVELEQGSTAGKIARLQRWYSETRQVYEALGKDTSDLYRYFSEQERQYYAESDKTSQEYLNLQLQRLEQQGASIREQQEFVVQFMADTAETFSEGMLAGLAKVELEFGDFARFAAESVADVANTFSSSFASAFTDVITGTKSVKEGFAALGKAIIEQLAQVIAKLLVMWMIQQAMSAMSSLFGGSGIKTAPAGLPATGAGGALRVHTGGMIGDGALASLPRLHVGNVVDGRLEMPWPMQDLKPGEVPAVLLEREAVLSREMVSRNQDLVTRILRDGGSRDIEREIRSEALRDVLQYHHGGSVSSTMSTFERYHDGGTDLSPPRTPGAVPAPVLETQRALTLQGERVAPEGQPAPAMPKIELNVVNEAAGVEAEAGETRYEQDRIFQDLLLRNVNQNSRVRRGLQRALR